MSARLLNQPKKWKRDPRTGQKCRNIVVYLDSDTYEAACMIGMLFFKRDRERASQEQNKQAWLATVQTAIQRQLPPDYNEATDVVEIRRKTRIQTMVVGGLPN